MKAGRNLLDLTSADGVETKRVSSTHGAEYAGPCPRCGGRDRFRIWPEEADSGRYWCRQCGCNGDVIQYLRDFRKMSFKDACKFVGKEIGPHTSWSGNKIRGSKKASSDIWVPRETAAPPNLWQEKAQYVLSDAESWLFKPHPLAQQMMKWLVGERGLSLDTIRTYRFGLVIQNRWDGPERWGLEPELKEDGSVKKIWVPRGLAIPLCQDDKVLRIRIRRLREDGDPRYYLLRGSDTQALILGKERDAFVVVESELDAILLHQEAGDLVGVIALGNAQARPDQEAKKVLARAKLILIGLDADQAGAKEAWQWWQKKFCHSRRWPPVAKDISEMLAAGVSVRDWVLVGLEEYAENPQEVCNPEEHGSTAPVEPFSFKNQEELENAINLALEGQLLNSVQVPVLPAYRDILGQNVWFCPTAEEAASKAPDLAFTGEELIELIPLLHENRQLAAILITAKQVFQGVILDSSSFDPEVTQPFDDLQKVATDGGSGHQGGEG